jgi:hypothetical protein
MESIHKKTEAENLVLPPISTEVEFKDKSSSTARPVIEPCLKKKPDVIRFENCFFRDLFLYHEH